MEALLLIFLPVALLWVGLGLLSGRPPSPDAVLRSTSRLLWQLMRWLWKDRRKVGGGGRVKRPPLKYRR